MYTSSFQEPTPEYRICGESTSPIFFIVERLRVLYGGNVNVVPWSTKAGREAGPVRIDNLPSALATDCNISLGDYFKIFLRAWRNRFFS